MTRENKENVKHMRDNVTIECEWVRIMIVLQTYIQIYSKYSSLIRIYKPKPHSTVFQIMQRTLKSLHVQSAVEPFGGCERRACNLQLLLPSKWTFHKFLPYLWFLFPFWPSPSHSVSVYLSAKVSHNFTYFQERCFATHECNFAFCSVTMLYLYEFPHYASVKRGNEVKSSNS